MLGHNCDGSLEKTFVNVSHAILPVAKYSKNILAHVPHANGGRHNAR